MRITLQQAVDKLIHDEVVAIPTETVYGLAASIHSSFAIDNIFKIKGRPSLNPLIIHVDHWDQAQPYVKNIPPYTLELTYYFWPGPLTLVLPIDLDKVPAQARANLPTAAFRMPNHPITLSLLSETGPLVAPSANHSGKPSATSPEHVESDFGLTFPVLDGGTCEKGLESTILGYNEDRWKVYRLGAITPSQFQHALGYIPEVLEKIKDELPLCPGQLFRHYAPKAQLILARYPQNVPIVVGFTDRIYPGIERIIPWGSSNNPLEIAHNLYETLRQLDRENIEKVWIDIDFPSEGLWLTILERLQKAGMTAPL